jgi:hypothetical protein
VRRREFIKVVAGSAVAPWPLAARAQQDRIRRIVLLSAGLESDPRERRRDRRDGKSQHPTHHHISEELDHMTPINSLTALDLILRT